jgi:hypothetical protein
MSSRPKRSPLYLITCLIQTLFAFMVFAVITIVFAAAGSSLATATSRPFDWRAAASHSAWLVGPFNFVLSPTVYLWLRSRWGWYLTFVTNSVFACLAWSGLYGDLRQRVTKGYWSSPLGMVFFEAMVLAASLTPMILLLLPSNRHEFPSRPHPLEAQA